MYERRFTGLSNRQLLGRLKNLIAKEREDLVQVIVHLGEVEYRRIYAVRGYDSMYKFCQKELHFSEHQAFLRINAARLAKRYPAVLSMLADGRIHMSALAALKPHLTELNSQELLEACTHKSKREVELLVAERFPRYRTVPGAGAPGGRKAGRNPTLALRSPGSVSPAKMVYLPLSRALATMLQTHPKPAPMCRHRTRVRTARLRHPAIWLSRARPSQLPRPPRRGVFRRVMVIRRRSPHPRSINPVPHVHSLQSGGRSDLPLTSALLITSAGLGI
jgi:hypothetical protein